MTAASPDPGDAARGLLVVVAGPSGVGKGTVVRRLLRRLPSARLSVSVTTRPPRPGEHDGVDYHFVDDATFEQLVRDDELLEWAEYAGNRYGTPRAWVDGELAQGRDVLLEIEVQGALQVRERFPGALLIFLVPPRFVDLEQRLRGRGTEQGEVLERRLATARRELDQQGAFDHVIVNDDLERCVDEVLATLAAARDARS